MTDITDPVTGYAPIQGFGATTAPYATADLAYNAWATARGFATTDTEQTIPNNSNVPLWVTLGYSLVDGGTYKSFLIGQSGLVQLFAEVASDPLGLYTTFDSRLNAAGGPPWIQVVDSTKVPYLTIGAASSAYGSGYHFQTYDLKFHDGMNAASPVQEVIMIMTCGPNTAYPVTQGFKLALRIRPGFVEMYVTLIANIPTYVFETGYVIGNTLSSAFTSGVVLDASLTTTDYYVSRDLGPYRPSASEKIAAHANLVDPHWSLSQVVTQPVHIKNLLVGVIGCVIAQNLHTHAATPTFLYRPGATASEIIKLKQTHNLSAIYHELLSSPVRLHQALQTVQPVHLTQNMTVHPALALVRALLVLEALKLTDTLSPTAHYTEALVGGIKVHPNLARFLGASVTQGMSVHPALSKMYVAYPGVTEHVHLGAAATTPNLIISAICDESIDIDDDAILNSIFSPVVSENICFSAAYVSPDTNIHPQSGSGQTSGITIWSINTRMGYVTEYSNYSFNSFARMGHKYFGAAQDGLYELVGDTDDSIDIIADIKAGFSQFGGSKFSSFKAAYLGIRGTGKFIFKLITGDGKEYYYNVSAEDMRTTKVSLGKGLRARYFAWELISADGADFDLDTVEFIPLVAQRRV